MGDHEDLTFKNVTINGMPFEGFKDIDFSNAIDCSSLIFPIEVPDLEIPLKVVPHYPDWHFIMALLGLETLSNNFLKLHGLPMRRRYVGKHTSQRGGRK